jgi:hypothetical protein
LTLLSAALGLLSIVAALALPFAPVLVNRPVISWPVDPSAARPTMAMLTAYRPLSVDASFSCRQVAAAATTPEGVVVATTRPDSPAGTGSGLVVSVVDGRLSATSRGVLLAEDQLRPGSCRYVLSGSGDDLTLSRDGRELGRGPMPDVDALTTSVPVLPGATAADLSVRVTVDDRFAGTPAPMKKALLVLLVITVVGALACLVVLDRGRRRPPRRPAPGGRGRATGALVDGAVLVALTVWTFVGPLTPDDGYYSAMATNTSIAGYVGNYYQLFNQSYVPFTWFYQLLAWWQCLVGASPVMARVPAVVLGLLTWWCVRRLVVAFPRDAGEGLARASSVRGLLTTAAAGIAFLAWWMPFDLGTRPEPAIALATVAALLGVVLAVERGSLTMAGLAVAAASLGATAAPTGLVALAPLLVALPRLWPLLRGNGGPVAAIGRIACVLAPGGVGAAAGFADGSWRDFLRTQQILDRAGVPGGWTDEYLRWASLFDPNSVSYAVRGAVLITVLALVAFAVLWAAGRARDRPLPSRLEMTGATVLVAFLLLSPTPSKPWMHFGAVAGVGAALLAGLAVEAPRAVKDLSRRAAPRWGPLVLGAVVLVLVLALAGAGPNVWWLAAWEPLRPHAGVPPQVWVFRFDQPLWWAVGAVVLGVAFHAVAARWRQAWTGWAPVLALSATVVVFLAANVVYMLGTFGLDALRTTSSWSLAAQNVRDPAALACSAGSWVEAADPAGPPLAVDPRTPPPPTAGSGFQEGTGWFVDPPPIPSAAGGSSWGSLVPGVTEPGVPREASTGSVTTSWWSLPAADPDRTVTALVAGRTGQGNALQAEYARFGPAGPEVLESRTLGENPDPREEVVSAAWRSVDLGDGPPDAQVVRLVAVDGRTDAGGWIAFTSPRVSVFTPIDRLIGDRDATLLHWPSALLFPCLRQPRIEHGITEPAQWAVAFGDEPLEMLRDASAQVGRGGILGQTTRQASVLQLTARFRLGFGPEDRAVQVFRFQQPHAPAAYTLAVEQEP